MTNITETTKAVATVKAPSKKSVAVGIFQAKMVERDQGLFGTNKEFRAAVLIEIQSTLGVSTASAATMFNACKTDAEKVNPAVGLGRDPKKVKEPSTGKRGRPAGSHNKAKDVVPEVAVAEVATATETPETVAV